jgi:hypothetical protein
MVMTPIRVSPVLAAWVTVTVPFPFPKNWLAESQFALLLVLQVENEDEMILKVKLPELAGAA